MTIRDISKIAFLAFLALATSMVVGGAAAAPPVVKTVPWVATQPLVPHDTFPGRQITLKGTSSVAGATVSWSWDFGDGNPPATGTVTDAAVIQATHVYSGPIGTVWTARLTVTATSSGEFGAKEYYVIMRDQSLAVEVNVAIDEGLWYLHKTQIRYDSAGVQYGNWTSCSSWGCYASSGYYGITALNINAFEVNGHLESGDPSDPYVDTVARGMRWIPAALYSSGVAPFSIQLPATVNPDGNGDGFAVYVNQGFALYQGGMFIDALVASGAPGTVAVTGPLAGSTYGAIVQNMTDGYVNCIYPYSPGGGWRYNCRDYPDNSASQWGAIGLIPAQGLFGAVVDPSVEPWNKAWLAYTQDASGAFGYTNPGSWPWGPYADTASGMVQLVMDRVGRGGTGAPSWDKAETFMRDRFCETGGPTVSLRDYYYGLFSFVKSMLFAVQDGTSDPVPGGHGNVMLHSSTPGVPDMDWYNAEAALGDPCDGVARTLVSEQDGGGFWWAHNVTGDQFPLETAMAVIMLNQTIIEPRPIAVARATPNPGTVGATITLDGSQSYHPVAAKHIVQWQWDLTGTGNNFTLTGPNVQTSFPAIADYPVMLQVTDDIGATGRATVVVRIATPPISPTANAGGPYILCPQSQPWFLDGSRSVNPDDGAHDPGAPGDLIKAYEWDLQGNNVFIDAFGARPDVTSFYTARGPGAYSAILRVKDNTAASFPSSGSPDLTSTSQAYVFVKAATDPACSDCIHNLQTYAKARGLSTGFAQLSWTNAPAADHYDIYRSTTLGGPYTLVGTTRSRVSVYVDAPIDVNQRYYYMIREAALNGDEICQSNEASAMASTRQVPVLPALSPALLPLPVDQTEFGFNVDGTVYDSSANVNFPPLPGELPGGIDTSGFDFESGVGTVEVTFSTPGAHKLIGFFDHEMNMFADGVLDETVTQFGTRASGQSWQAETPNDVYGNMSTGSLINFNEFGPAEDGTGQPVNLLNDVSMAIGWDFNLDPGQSVRIRFVINHNVPPSGLYLKQTDNGVPGVADPVSLYFFSTLQVEAHTVCGDQVVDLGEECDDGSANGTSGSCCTTTCSFKPTGAQCNDGNACTTVDTCSGGVCVGASPVVCSASDQCHVAGTCNPGTGVCSNPSAANGTTCSDGNACTRTDTCQSGSCRGSNRVFCKASDQCHVAGTCNTGTGVCSNPIKANGTTCCDGNACTRTDTCQAGSCTGSNPVVCTARDQCHVAGTCNTGTGVCSNPNAANGTTCNDGNACTSPDTCSGGQCIAGLNACTVTGVVEADVTLRSSEPCTNFGRSKLLEADGSPQERFLIRVRVNGVGAGHVTRAILKLQVASPGDSAGAESWSGGRIHASSCSWNETAVTWNTRPFMSGTVLDSKGDVDFGQWVNFDVTSAIRGDGTFCFAVDSLASDGVDYNSLDALQASKRPVLILATTP